MIEESTLEKIVTRIVTIAQPSRIILFGSYGRGEANEDSDVDLMIIKPQVDNPYEEMLRLRQVIGPIGAGVDVLV